MIDVYLQSARAVFNLYAQSWGLFDGNGNPQTRVGLMHVDEVAETPNPLNEVHIVRLTRGAYQQYLASDFDSQHPQGATVGGVYRMTNAEARAFPGQFAGGRALGEDT